MSHYEDESTSRIATSMDEQSPVLMVFIIVSAALFGLAVLAIAWHIRSVRQRRQRLECLAREMRFTFYSEAPGISPDSNSPIALYQLGLTAWARNMLHGTRY